MRTDFTALLNRTARVRRLLETERNRNQPSWLRLARLQRLQIQLSRRLQRLVLVPVAVPVRVHSRRPRNAYTFG